MFTNIDEHAIIAETSFLIEKYLGELHFLKEKKDELEITTMEERQTSGKINEIIEDVKKEIARAEKMKDEAVKKKILLPKLILVLTVMIVFVPLFALLFTPILMLITLASLIYTIIQASILASEIRQIRKAIDDANAAIDKVDAKHNTEKLNDVRRKLQEFNNKISTKHGITTK